MEKRTEGRKLKETVISDTFDLHSYSDDSSPYPPRHLQPDNLDGCCIHDDCEASYGTAHNLEYSDQICSSSVQPVKKRRITRTNLFQLWGLENPNHGRLDLQHEQGRQHSTSFNINNKNHKTGETATSFASHKTQQPPRIFPFYKRIPGTPFTVDAFYYGLVKGCSAYFLSHFHADHYISLTKVWSHGPIYCTNLIARLLRICLNVSPSFICPLELGTEYSLKGIKVTMLDANHCPGAALIHFRLPNGQCYLHTGDFRAMKLMQSYPVLTSQRINILYLDTTYCNPKYRFPSKEDV